jgi:hypothetical protein
MAGPNYQSTITIGGYDKTQFKDLYTKPIAWFPLTSSSRWELEIRDFQFGNKSFFASDSNQKAIINTFYEFISLTNSDFQKFKDYLAAEILLASCDDATGFCSFPGKCIKLIKRFPDIKIQFNDKKIFTVPPTNYLTDTLVNGYDVCRIDINRGD